MTSKLINKHNKRKIYMTLMRPVVPYGCETWTLYKRHISLLVFERHIVRYFDHLV
jgi:hypothetical protein